MHKAIRQPKSNFDMDNTYEAESIEQKMRRMMQNGEPIESMSPLIYTNKKDGVLPAYDIRTDRFEVALTGNDRINNALNAQRMAAAQKQEQEKTA